MSELKKNWLRQDEMAPYKAIGLVQENFKVKYGSMKKEEDRDLKLFFRLLETKFNQEMIWRKAC